MSDCAASACCAASSCAGPTAGASRPPGVSGLVSAEAKRRGLMIYSCPTPVGNEHMDALLLAPPLIVTEQRSTTSPSSSTAPSTAVEAAL